MAKIFIASKDVVTVGEHSYWVFDADGNAATTSDQRIIRGGDTDQLDGIYILEVDRPLADSRDDLNGADQLVDRNYTTMFDGTFAEAESKWLDMVAAAESLGTEVDDPDQTNYAGEKVIQLDETGYYLFDSNCNAATNTIGNAGGFSITSASIKEKAEIPVAATLFSIINYNSSV